MNGRARTISCVLSVFACFPLSAQDDSTPAGVAELARKYQNGIGCPRDIGRALLYYKKAAAAGDAGSMVELGDLYREGICVPQDLKYSLSMYRQAAEAGFAPGMMRLGEALESSARRHEALDWFRKAASKGYGPAMTHLGDELADTEWYRRAVTAGDPAAFARLAENVPSAEAHELLRRGAELGDPAAQARYGLRIEKDDAVAAAKLFRSSAEAGDPIAMAKLASFCEKGLGGVEQSPGEALVWYTKAAGKGEPNALYWMARRQESGGDPAAARDLYRKAVSSGHAPSMYRLAKLNGDSTLLRLAASAGDVDAVYALALETRDEEGLRRAAAMGHTEAIAAVGDPEKAAARGHIPSLLKLGRFREAADLGSAEGLLRYGLSFSDKAEGTRYIQRAADAGFPPAMRELGLRLRSGTGIAADPAAAKEWFGKAAAANDPESLYYVGGEASIRRSAQAGYAPAMVRLAELTGERSWLEKAAAAGYVNALTKLGELDRAAAAGDPEAQLLLAEKTKNGREAYRLLLQAAESGYAPAMRRLGDFHMEGRGTSVSEIDGVNWYRKAVLHGDEEAARKLQRLGKTL